MQDSFDSKFHVKTLPTSTFTHRGGTVFSRETSAFRIYSECWIACSFFDSREFVVDSSPLDGSVTILLDRLKAGDPDAASPLWQGYCSRLAAVARGKLRGLQIAIADEEDVALSALDSFCRGVERGRFPRLDDRDDLWQVLFVIADRKASGLVRREWRDKRGGGKVRQASTLCGDDDSRADLFDGLAGTEPSPEFAAQVAEECQRLLALLNDGKLRRVAIWKMEGYTNAEIAVKIGRSIPTVERKLSLIRRLWERESRG